MENETCDLVLVSRPTQRSFGLYCRGSSHLDKTVLVQCTQWHQQICRLDDTIAEETIAIAHDDDLQLIDDVVRQLELISQANQ